MNKDKRYISIITNSDTLNKIHYISEYYGRSINEQIIHLIENCVSEYERKVGPIEIDSSNKK